MNTSPNNVFIDAKCLSLEQLRLYHEDKLAPKDKHKVEDHLLDCELCSTALLGFAVIPVTQGDVDGLNRNIDKLSGAKQPAVISPKFFIGIAAMVMISVSCFFVYKSFSPKEVVVADNNAPVVKDKDLFTSGQPPKNTIVLDTKNADVKELITARLTDVKPPKVEVSHPNEAFTMEMLEMKSPDIILTDKKNPLDEENMKVPVLILGNDTFILDLKITDFDKYYYVNMNALKAYGGHNNTDPMFENDKERDNGGVYKLQEWEVTTTAQVLKSALAKFNTQDYENSIKLFNALIKHNADDVNALFYGGVCYFNSGSNEKALDYFTRVINSTNGSFYEEAKWYKALTYLKKRDGDMARKLLAEIVADNGFYKEQAKEKLKGL
jgi:hypothetical protein